MPLFTGETVRVMTSATGLDGSALTDSDVSTAEVTIYDSTGSVVVATTPLSYNPTLQKWFYDWTTDGQPVGSYKAKIRLGSNTFDSWEYARIRLRANPV